MQDLTDVGSWSWGFGEQEYIVSVLRVTVAAPFAPISGKNGAAAITANNEWRIRGRQWRERDGGERKEERICGVVWTGFVYGYSSNISVSGAQSKILSQSLFFHLSSTTIMNYTTT